MCAKPCRRKCLQNYANNLNKVELWGKKNKISRWPEGRSNAKMKFFVGLEGRSNEKNMFRSRFAYFAAKIFFRSRIFFYICFIIIFKENRHEES